MRHKFNWMLAENRSTYITNSVLNWVIKELRLTPKQKQWMNKAVLFFITILRAPLIFPSDTVFSFIVKRVFLNFFPGRRTGRRAGSTSQQKLYKLSRLSYWHVWVMTLMFDKRDQRDRVTSNWSSGMLASDQSHLFSKWVNRSGGFYISVLYWWAKLPFFCRLVNSCRHCLRLCLQKSKQSVSK